ncbi:GGDEF domain-containing protein [Roseateles chitinivorans]|uniref:diguanylate cyclase n=1 Tax=Roseateles chitinivorans TaxID=2917965 RepID=A0A2G9C3A8_9BURK|nr:GGDEF domain-containing protein [Roseateles chitinivorans]PIM50858.1 GGDEF domain-containing protein [Roseateles chitinivorans]
MASIHIPTLMLALLSGFAMLGVQLWAAQRSRLRYLDLAVWTWGSWTLLAGFAMLTARVVVPVWVSALLGNGLIALGIVFYNEAIHRHVLGRALPRWMWWSAPTVAWALTAWMLTWPLAVRTSAISLVFALLLCPAILVLLGPGWRGESSLRAVGLTLVAAAASLLLRSVHALTNPEEYRDLMQSSLGQGLTFLFSFICLIGAGFGFVLANFERIARRMEEMASTDGLTGCLNRMTADALLRHELERGRREGTPLAFVLLDLDHFKDVNDCHGHHAGDDALRAFAAEVRARLRASDVVGRWGGEEFGLVLPATDGPGAARLVEQIREAVATLRLCDGDGHDFTLTVSAGIAVAEPGGQLTADQLFMRADRALYRAKDGGRNNVQLHDSGWELGMESPAA